MAHIVSHKTGSRIIVHGSTTAKSENLPVLSLTGSEFVMLMRKSEGSTRLAWKPFVWSRKLQTGPWSPHTGASSPRKTYFQETPNLVPAHLVEHKPLYEWSFLSPDLLSSFRLLFRDPSPCSDPSSCRVGLCRRSWSHLSSPWFSGVGVVTRRTTFLMTFLLMRLPSWSI